MMARTRSKRFTQVGDFVREIGVVPKEKSRGIPGTTQPAAGLGKRGAGEVNHRNGLEDGGAVQICQERSDQVGDELKVAVGFRAVLLKCGRGRHGFQPE